MEKSSQAHLFTGSIFMSLVHKILQNNDVLNISQCFWKNRKSGREDAAIPSNKTQIITRIHRTKSKTEI